MPKPETLNQATKAIDARKPPGFDVRMAFWRGDHWQCGSQWVGPWPDPLTSKPKEIAVVRLEIERQFASSNIIKEIVERAAGGLLGREPAWNFVPVAEVPDGQQVPRETQILIDEAEAALTKWFDDKGVLSHLVSILQSFILTSSGQGRLFVPVGKLVDGTETGSKLIPAGTSFEDLLSKYLWFEAVPCDKGTVYEDPATMDTIGVFHQKGDRELGLEEMAEVTYVEDGFTVIKRFTRDRNAATELKLQIGGWPMMFGMRQDFPLCTDQVIQQQNAFNMTMTMCSRNIVLGGFLERVIMGAKIPGRLITDGEGNEVWEMDDGFQIGGGHTTFLAAEEISDGKDGVKATTPSISYREPVPTTTFQQAGFMWYSTMLNEARQAFVLMNTDGEASGISRLVARTDFARSLFLAKFQLDKLIRQLLESVLRIAALIGGTPKKYDSIKAISTVKIDLGPLTPEEIKVVMELVKAEMISAETGRVLLQVEDPDAEKTLIMGERKGGLTLDQIKSLSEAVTKIGYSMDPKEQGAFDEMFGLPKRTPQQIEADQAEAEELAHNRLKDLATAKQPAASGAVS